jgi:hypothetical protein
MGEAKRKQRMAFPSHLIAEWEKDDCVNFAIALARISGWLLHVDWMTSSTRHDDEDSEQDMILLRVYVADNADNIFDVRGVKKLFDFVNGTVKPLIRIKEPKSACGVRTRFYSEERLLSLPLRFKPDEEKISAATTAIQENIHFLNAIPVRRKPCIPAANAAKFSFGRCQPFAQALAELKGLRAAGLLAIRFDPMFDGTQRSSSGFFHSIALHADGDGEDSWGKASIQEIANRFGVVEFRVCENEHAQVINNLRANSADRYNEAYEEAKELINTHL